MARCFQRAVYFVSNAHVKLSMQRKISYENYLSKYSISIVGNENQIHSGCVNFARHSKRDRGKLVFQSTSVKNHCLRPSFAAYKTSRATRLPRAFTTLSSFSVDNVGWKRCDCHTYLHDRRVNSGNEICGLPMQSWHTTTSIVRVTGTLAKHRPSNANPYI